MGSTEIKFQRAMISMSASTMGSTAVDFAHECNKILEYGTDLAELDHMDFDGFFYTFQRTDP